MYFGLNQQREWILHNITRTGRVAAWTCGWVKGFGRGETSPHTRWVSRISTHGGSWSEFEGFWEGFKRSSRKDSIGGNVA